MQPGEFSKLMTGSLASESVRGLDAFRLGIEQRQKMSRLFEDGFATAALGKDIADKMGIKKFAAPGFSAQVAAQMQPGMLSDSAAQAFIGRVNFESISPNLSAQVTASLPSVKVMDQFAKQQGILHDLTRKPLVASSLAANLSPGLIDSATVFRNKLRGEAEAAAEEASREEALSSLAARRQEIVVCLDRVAKTVTALKLTGLAPIPTFIVALLIVAAVMGEVADEMLVEGEEGDEAGLDPSNVVTSGRLNL